MAALSCPSCGASHSPENPGIALIACGYCGTTLYREGDLLRAGKEARLAEPRSALRVGATGKAGSRTLRLVGRAGFSWGDGRWDEWYAEDASTGEGGWLVEDARRYAWEREIAMPEGAAELSGLGHTLRYDGGVFEVRELGEATCEGAEGQLPRPVLPGEVYRYVDLDEIDGDRRLLLEFGPNGDGEAFLGEVLRPEQVDFGPVPEPMGGASEAAVAVRCPQCGAPNDVPPQGDRVRTLSCGHCDAVYTPEGEVGVLLGRRKKTPPYVLEVGATGTLDGVEWEVVGRLHYKEPCGWRTYEYLLWNRQKGYLWLAQSGGHFTTTRPAVKTPSVKVLQGFRKGRKVRVDGALLKMIEKGSTRLVHVDGALPWSARIGENHEFIDLAGDLHVGSVELGATEIEVFAGIWRPHTEVYKAFGRAPARYPPAHPHHAQPNPWASWLPSVGLLGIAVLVNVVLMFAFGFQGRDVATVSVPAGVPSAQAGNNNHVVDEYVSDPFEMDPAQGHLSAITLRAPLSNSWLWAGIEVVDVEDELEDDPLPVGVLTADVSYYSGVEGGESWSEGSRTSSTYFKTLPKGTYVLRVTTESNRAHTATLRIQTGVYRIFPLGLNVALLVLVMMVLFIGYAKFEGSRGGDD